MKYILNNYHHNTPDEALLRDIRKNAKKLGKLSISSWEYEQTGIYSRTTLRRRFGSWNNALVKAGLKISRPASQDELMNSLKHVWDTLKRQPLRVDMVKPLSGYSPETYARKFGSWRQALEAFVSLQGKSGKQYPELTKKSAARPGKIKRKKKLAYNITKSMRFDIMMRDKFKCKICGRSPATHPNIILHVDHIIPRSKGGETVTENLWTLCNECNYGKGAKTM